MCVCVSGCAYSLLCCSDPQWEDVLACAPQMNEREVLEARRPLPRRCSSSPVSDFTRMPYFHSNSNYDPLSMKTFPRIWTHVEMIISLTEVFLFSCNYCRSVRSVDVLLKEQSCSCKPVSSSLTGDKSSRTHELRTFRSPDLVPQEEGKVDSLYTSMILAYTLCFTLCFCIYLYMHLVSL